MAIAIVAHSPLSSLVSQLDGALPIAGFHSPNRSQLKDSKLPHFNDLGSMLSATKPRLCTFLSPYPTLREDVLCCLQNGIDVIAAGPIPHLDLETTNQALAQTEARLAIGGIHHTSPLFNTALKQRNQDSFATPVYLRLLAGVQGPGLQPAWWAACQQWAMATDLLEEKPEQLHLCSNRQGRAYHLTLTARAPSGALIQIIIAPQRYLSEMTFLGRGGLIAASSAQSGIVLTNNRDTQVVHDTLPPAELEWLDNFYEHRDPPSESSCDFSTALLRGIRQALKQNQPILLTL